MENNTNNKKDFRNNFSNKNNFKNKERNNNPSNNQDNEKKGLPPLYVYPLGGQGEVGKNCYCIEMGNEIFVIDAGIKFFNDSLSIEGIIPSYEHLKRNVHKIKGLIVTHGHEDHIGSIPHLLYQVKIPRIYTGRLAGALLDSKVRERRVEKPPVIVINNKSYIKTRNFFINFYNVLHSTPDSYGLEIRTKHGTVVSTGDFKFDFTPIGQKIDIKRIAQFGDEDVTLLLSDSTNAETNKWSPSESDVAKKLEELIKKATGKILVTTFASNVFRVREVINIAVKCNKKIAVFGWSMDKVVKISQKIKYINVPESQFIDEKEIKNTKPEELLILCTGGQGEQSAALSKIANEKNNNLRLTHGDTVIFASNAIPGNYESVEKLTNKLIKLGVTVLDNNNSPGVHTSGHAGSTEQKLMINLIRPKYFLPIHGETKMLIAHGKSAQEVGIKKENIFIIPNGGRLKIENKIVSQVNSVYSENIFVDDTNLTGQSNRVISERDIMAKNGVITVSIGIDSSVNKIIIKPKVFNKGVFNERSNKDFIASLENSIFNSLNDFYQKNTRITFSGLKELLKTETERIIFEKKKITPVIIPIIVNISDSKINRNNHLSNKENH